MDESAETTRYGRMNVIQLFHKLSNLAASILAVAEVLSLL